MNINYQDQGAGQSIIIMHGWGGSMQSLQGLADELALNGFRVINVDLPGFGKSVISQTSMKMGDYVAEVKELIEYLELKQPILLGHSFGGKTALFLANQYPKLISGIVLVNASGIIPIKSRRKKITYAVAKTFGKILQLPLIRHIAQPLRYLYYRLIVGEMDYFRSQKLKETFKLIVKEHADNFLATIKNPTLIIWGENDMITPLYMAKKLHTSIINSELKIVSAAHNLPLVNPKLVSQEIVQWTKKYNI